VLSAARTYYVRTDGSDANDGLANTSGGAFATIQHAINQARALDKSQHGVVINIGAGVYTENLTISDGDAGNPYSSPIISLVGDAVTPANVRISGYLYIYYARGVSLLGLEFDGTVASYGSAIALAGACRFKSGFGSGNLGYFEAGSCIITGGSYGEGVYAYDGGVTLVYGLTVEGTPAFSSSFAAAWYAGRVAFLDQPSGSATGKRFVAEGAGIVDCYGAAEDFLPGDAAGTTATGGQYIGGGFTVASRFRGAWDSGTSYIPGDLVEHNGSTWINTSGSSSTGDEPGSTGDAVWELIAAAGADGTGTGVGGWSYGQASLFGG